MFINTQKFEDDFIFQIPNSLPELPPPCVYVCVRKGKGEGETGYKKVEKSRAKSSSLAGVALN